MLLHEHISALVKAFPILNQPDFLNEIKEVGVWSQCNEGTIIMEPGFNIEKIPLLLKGQIKVQREEESGKELFLYFIYPGEACALSFICSGMDRKSRVKAYAVEDCEFINIPVDLMREWMNQFPCWYQLVVQTYSWRFEDLLETIDSVAFHRLDERILNYLDKLVESTGSTTLNITHFDIARELSSTREVVSRLLKKMEHDGMLKLGRNQIQLIYS